MDNDSTIGVGFFFITPSVVVLLCICGFWVKVCFLGILCVFGASSWHRHFFVMDGWRWWVVKCFLLHEESC